MIRWSRRTVRLPSLLNAAFFLMSGIIASPIEGADQQLRAAQNDPGIVAGTPDVPGATQAGTEFQRRTPSGQPPGPTSGAAGGGPPIEQPGLQPPPGAALPTTGTGGPVGPGFGYGVWCYSEKTRERYWLPYGPCPPPYVKPPTYPKPTCGPTTVCTCPGGKIGYVPCDASKGLCYCGGE